MKYFLPILLLFAALAPCGRTAQVGQSFNESDSTHAFTVADSVQAAEPAPKKIDPLPLVLMWAFLFLWIRHIKYRRSLLIAMLFIVPCAHADSPVLAQSCKGTYFGSTTQGNITLPQPVTSGDIERAYVFYGTTTTVSVSGTVSGSFTVRSGYPVSTGNSGFNNAAIYDSGVISSGGSDTISFNLSPATFAEMFVCEIAVQNASPNDQNASASGNSASASSGSVTTTAADLVIGVFQAQNNPVFTPTGGFTAQVTANSTNNVLAILTQNSAGAISATATLSSNPWFALVDTIKGTAATLQSISVTPSPSSVTASAGSPQQANTIQFLATGSYSDSTQKNLTGAANWTSSNTVSATIASGGLVTATTTAGSTTITATLNTTSGTSGLTVNENPYDAYWGLQAVPCSNVGNTAFSLDLTTYPKNPVLCTPLGHAMFSRGFFVQDQTQGGTADESGVNYDTRVVTKYGSAANAGTQSLIKIKAWGMNTLPAFANTGLFPTTGNAPQMAFVYYFAGSEYSLVNKTINGNAGPGAAKDMMYYVGLSGATTTWKGQVAGGGVADYRDPQWLGTINHVLAADPNAATIASASSALKGYLLGFSLDEGDGSHGFGAGPDFATQPAGHNDFRLGYLTFFIPPVNWANGITGCSSPGGGSCRQRTYPDGKVYMKARMHDLLVAKYGTFVALNTAWGSSYTTMDSSGVCVGAQPVACNSSASADSVGTGNGATQTFGITVSHHVSIMKFSLFISIAGTIVGGDTGNGTIYGTGCGGLSGTINYTSGVLSVTCVTAPANGAAVTTGYIDNAGTGFMDELCQQPGHQSYCGTPNTTCGGNDCYSIYLCSDPTLTTCLPANVQTDIGVFSKDWAAYYSSTQKSAAQTWASAHGFTGNVLALGPSTLATWSTPPDKYVIQGVCGNIDVVMTGGQSTLSQAELDFWNTNCPNQPLSEGEYRTANAQSPYSWPNSACTHSGGSVTCALATPFQFVTNGLPITTTCSDSSWNVTDTRTYTVVSPNLTYTASGGSPVGTNATCNVMYDDTNVGGFATQALRASDFQTKVSALPTRAYTVGGVHPYTTYYWWQYNDKQAERLNWGAQDVRDNTFNGVEDVNSVVACSIPIAGFNCGGELRGPYGGGIIAAIQAANSAIDNALLAILANTTPSTVFMSRRNK